MNFSKRLIWSILDEIGCSKFTLKRIKIHSSNLIHEIFNLQNFFPWLEKEKTEYFCKKSISITLHVKKTPSVEVYKQRMARKMSPKPNTL